jgi:hypothetical protein
MASSVGPKKTAPAPSSAYQQVTLLPSKAVVLKVSTCLTYANAAKISAAVARGCVATESVSFPLGLDGASLGQWVTFNQGRLVTLAPCPTYGAWALEIAEDTSLAWVDRSSQLQKLYDDALAKGCLRAPS